jgi:tetratricopeptide (TPR) repeat protein
MGSRRIVLALGAAMVVVALILLVIAPPTAAVAQAAAYPTYAPTDPSTVVAKVVPRDPHELAMRRQLRATPDNDVLAAKIARIDVQRARSLSDPRYLGRAQATLSKWWALPSPPADVLLLRATIRQSLHDFISARADLEQLLARRPNDAQADLTLAVVETVTGDYAAARTHCAAVEQLAPPIYSITCNAQIDGVTGRVAQGRAAMAEALAQPMDPALRGWAVTAVAELAIANGDYATATTAFREALADDPEDAYARAGLADVLMWTNHPTEASTLLAGREVIDNLLVRRAIAEHLAHGPDEAKLVRAMRDRMAAAAERGDRIHVREEARFELEVEGDARRALSLALENWGVQKELADARLVALAARAANDISAATPVAKWVAANRVEDVQVRAALGGSL